MESETSTRTIFAAGAIAWKAAITGAKLDPSIRYRRGEPWRPATVVNELRGGELPRAEVEARIDELTVRGRLAHRVDLSRWTVDVEPEMAAFMAEATSGRA